MSGDATEIALDVIDPIVCDDIRSAAARADGSTLGRLCGITASACDELSSVVGGVVSSVPGSVRRVNPKARRSRGLRDKALEAQLEELKAVVDTLEGCERLFRVASDSEYCIIVDWEDVEEGMCVAAQLLREMATPPCTSVLCTGRVESVISEVERMSRVQLGVDSDRSAVSHLRFLKRGEVNTVSIAPRDVVGDAMRGLSAEDVRAFLSDHTSSDTTGEGVSGVAVVDGSVVVSVSIEAETVHAVTLVACVDSARFELPLQIGSTIFGTLSHTIPIKYQRNNSGMAITADGALMVISNMVTCTMAVYRLPEGVLVSEFGGEGEGPGEFNSPYQLCLTPSGTLLVADGDNHQIQELTLDGAHVRTISEGLDAGVITLSIAASSDTIAVGTTDYTARVMLFDLLSGSLLRCFGVSGSDEGQLEECYGLRFTPDGLHILLADNVGNRLSLFTLTGDFVRCIGADILDSPNEVEFTTNGDIIVAEFTIHRISVFSPDGSTRLRRFDGGEQAPLQYPTALAMHGNVLYVLNQNSNCVHVFQ